MDRASFVIGLDSSTTATKAIAWNNHGEIIVSAKESIPLSSPGPGLYEQNPDDWWQSAQKALKTITNQLNPGTIKALAISNQRETFVPLGNRGECLRPAILWLDERCKDDVNWFAGKIGRKMIHRITGKPVDYAPIVYRLAWMQRNEPVLYEKIHKVCDVHTYLVWKLTTSFKTSWASADPSGLFDLRNKKWSSVILNELGLHIDQLPETYCPGTILGRVSESAFKGTGLLEETLVVAGGGDGQAAGSGVNALSSERAYCNLGTAVVSGIYGEKYRTSSTFRTMSSCSEKGYYFESSLRAGTFALDWYIKNILDVDPQKQPGIYAQLEQGAHRIPLGSSNLLFLPYICGVMNPYWDSDARGAFIGLSASHTRFHMYRAILEGIAFELFFTLRAIEATTRRKIVELVAIGGGASSDLWCGIIADITGKTICIPEIQEASCLGAGIAASIGAGWYKTFSESAKAMTGIQKRYVPDMTRNSIYQKIFSLYKKIYPSIRKLRDAYYSVEF